MIIININNLFLQSKGKRVHRSIKSFFIAFLTALIGRNFVRQNYRAIISILSKVFTLEFLRVKVENLPGE